MKHPDKVLFAILSDPHCTSLMGLLHPDGIDLDDGQHVSPSVFQVLLWRHYQHVLGRIDELKPGRSVYVCLNGDLTDGTPHNSIQNITANRTIQRQIADDALTPLLEKAHRIFVLRGTPAHVDKQAQDEEQLARLWYTRGLPVERESESRYSWPELWLDASGVLIWVRHHVKGGGGIARTRNSPAVRLADDTINMCVDRGWKIPRLVFRSHAHQYHDSHDARPTCRAIITPAMQGMTEYAYKLDAAPADVGAALFCLNNGEIEYGEVIRKRPPAPRVWKFRAGAG